MESLREGLGKHLNYWSTIRWNLNFCCDLYNKGKGTRTSTLWISKVAQLGMKFTYPLCQPQSQKRTRLEDVVMDSYQPTQDQGDIPSWKARFMTRMSLLKAFHEHGDLPCSCKVHYSQSKDIIGERVPLHGCYWKKLVLTKRDVS